MHNPLRYEKKVKPFRLKIIILQELNVLLKEDRNRYIKIWNSYSKDSNSLNAILKIENKLLQQNIFARKGKQQFKLLLTKLS